MQVKFLTVGLLCKTSLGFFFETVGKNFTVILAFLNLKSTEVVFVHSFSLQNFSPCFS